MSSTFSGNGLDKQTIKEQEDLSKQREAEMVPVAKEIISLISSADLSLVADAGDDEKYIAVIKQVLELLLKKNIKFVDRTFLFQLVLKPFDQVREVVSASLSKSFDLALNKLFTKDFRELRLKDIDFAITGQQEENTQVVKLTTWQKITHWLGFTIK